MIIAHMGRNVNEYRKNFIRYLAGLQIICPKCGSATIFHDNYNRYLRIGENVELIIIQRVFCRGCGKTHAIIPDFIRPYKHYVIADIEGVLREIYDGVAYEHVETPASISTVKRWYREFKIWAPEAINALKTLLLKLFDKTEYRINLTQMKIFDALNHVLDFFPKIECNKLTIGKANLWLVNYMTGAYW